MNKNLLSLFCFLFVVLNLQAQDSVIDSLKNELSIHSAKDTIRVNLLNEIAYVFCKKDYEKSIAYAAEAGLIAEALDFKKGKARSLYIKGTVQSLQSNFDLGYQYFNEAIQLYKAIDFKKGIDVCYNGMGLNLSSKGEQRQALEHFEKSLLIKEEIGDQEGMAASFNNIGRIYVDLGNYIDAIKYYNKALKINREVNNEERMSHCFNNLGTIYSDQGNNPLALEYYNKSLSIDEKRRDTSGTSKTLNNLGIIYKNIQKYDKAIVTYEKALKLEENNIDKRTTAEILNNLGLVYKHKKNYEKANEYLKAALKISEEIKSKVYIATILNNIGDVYLLLDNNEVAFQSFENGKNIHLQIENEIGLCNSYLGIAKIYTHQKKYDRALDNALKSKAISSKLELLNYQRDVHQLLSEIYKKTNQYKKALASHQQFKILNDSLFNKENIEKVTQLEYEYKYQQALDSASIRELELTETVKTAAQNLEKSQRNYLLAIIGFLLVSMLLGAIIFYQKFKNIKSKNQNIITEQKLLRSQMTPHFIFNSLSVLQGMILNKEDGKSVSYLSKFSKLLRIILENSRDQMVMLAKEMTAVENYLALHNLENESYQYSVLIDDAIEQSLFKIPPMLIQPFVENAIEHAFINHQGDKKIEVYLKYVEEELICTIADNGIGINFQEGNKRKDKKSLATTITTERLKIISKDFKRKGSVIIEDRKKHNQQGTIVKLIIPYQKLVN